MTSVKIISTFLAWIEKFGIGLPPYFVLWFWNFTTYFEWRVWWKTFYSAYQQFCVEICF